MDDVALEFKLQSVLLLVEAAAYLWLAWWCLARANQGRWASSVGVGAALVGVALGLSAAASFEQIFLDSTHLYEKVFFHQHFSLVYTVARVAGVLLLVAGVVLSRRTPARDRSIYGP